MITTEKLARDAQINPIYQSMRGDSLRIDIEDATVVKESNYVGQIRIPAWISQEQDHLYLNLRGIPKQAAFEEAISQFGRLQGKSATIKASDCFQVRAQTEAGIPVLLEGVSPVTGRGISSYSQVGGRRCHEQIDFSRISFPTAGMDAQNAEELMSHLHEVGDKDPEAGEVTTQPVMKDEFYAVLPDVEQRIFNGGTESETNHPFHGEQFAFRTDCFTGDLHGGEFCLEKHDAGMLIDLRCPAGNAATEEARAKFDGILQAIAFIHGCNPWPDYFCHRRDNQVIERWVHPRSQLQKNSLRPLLERDLNSQISTKGEKLFLAAANFFANPTKEASKFNINTTIN